MKVQGKKELENVIHDFLAEHFDEFRVRIGADFGYVHRYDDKPSKIIFAIGCPAENGFLENLNRRYKPSFVCDIALISLFHEVFHHVTWDDFTEEEHDFFHTQKESIENLLSTGDNKYIRDMYFGVADEEIATRKAVEWIEANTQVVSEWWNGKLQPALMEFYKKNGLEI